ncbi:MAG: hypothetical protein K8J31_18645 [Anaerolineae bacterium]|nr:hypothetical protein [Anaerolineae bacterium]
MSAATLIAVLIVVAAVLTLIPYPKAKKKNSLGYRALCTFTPISSIVLVVVAGIVWLIGSLA